MSPPPASPPRLPAPLFIGPPRRSLDRRQFCKGLGAVALLPACRGVPRAQDMPDADPPPEMKLQTHGGGLSRVVEVRWADAVDPSGQVNASKVETMIQAAMVRLMGPDPWGAWAAFDHQISLKVNSITSQAYTHPQVAATMARGLVSAGADPAKVTVWDRDTSSLAARGYEVDKTGKGGFRCVGTDGAGIAGSPQSAVVAGQKIYLSRILTDSDALINVAALKDHSMAGVTLTLKNNFGMIAGAEVLHGKIHQGSACEPGISELAALPQIRDRLRLGVIDALVGVCEGGPGSADPGHVFRYGGILVGRDPVTLDRRGLAIIEAWRARLGLVPLAKRTKPNPSPPIHIDNAAALGVGLS